jgi:hypothetical protein
MSQISLKSISGITSITTPSGVDNQLTVHTSDTTERIKITSSGLSVAGVSTFTGLVDCNGGARIDNIKLGVDTNEEISTQVGNLTLDSASGTVIVADNLDVDGTAELDLANITGIATFMDAINVADIIRHGGDPDTYVRFPSNDTITLGTAGGERIHITSDGKIGMKTTSPQKDLHVYNSSVATVRIETGDSRGQAWDILSTNGAQNNTGTLSFRDESGSAYLEFGANEGSPQFRVRNGGANDLFHIDNSGRVTKPYHPSFCARHNSGDGFSGDIIVLTRISTSWDVWNTGNHYSTSTGKFTVPVAGVYYFEGQVMTTGHNNGDNIQDMLTIMSNRGRISYCRQRKSYFRSDEDANGYYTNSVGGSARLNAGDEVYLQRKSGHSWGYSNRYYSYFTGWLIG